VQKLCRQAIWLKDGRIEASGDAFEVTQRYQAWLEQREARDRAAAADAVAVGDMRVTALRVDGRTVPRIDLAMHGDLEVEVEITSRDDRPPALSLGLLRADGTPVYGVDSLMDAADARAIGDGAFAFAFRYDRLPLLPGDYVLRAFPMDAEGLRLFAPAEVALRIRGESREFGLVRLPHRWGAP
jgi:lipopolysaccharide transport system ATP-binding protein